MSTSKPLSYSSVQAFKDCRRKYFYRYILGLVPLDRGDALSVGSIAHKCLERLLTGCKNSGETIGYALGCLTDDNVRYIVSELFRDSVPQEEYSTDNLLLLQEMLVAWVHQARGSSLSGMKVLEVEWPFEFSVGRVKVKGFVDAIVSHNGMMFPLEHKTVSGGVTDRRIHNLMFNDQPSMYLSAVRQLLGADTNTVIYNFLPKSSLTRATATPFERRKYKADGTLYASMRDKDEDDASYSERLRNWYDEYADKFAIHMATKSDAQLSQYISEVANVKADIRHAKSYKRWYRNPSACQMLYCPYSSICLEQYEGGDQDNVESASALVNFTRDNSVAGISKSKAKKEKQGANQ